MQHLDDSELANAITLKPNEALAEINSRYGKMLFAVVTRYSVPACDVLPLLQDVWVKISRGNFDRRKGHLRAWLSTIASRRAIDYARQTRRYRQTFSAIEDLENGSLYIEQEDPMHTDQQAMDNEVKDMLSEALQGLPVDQREAVTLACIQGHSHSQTAKILGVSIGTAKQRIRLGLIKLRGLLKNPKFKNIR